MVDTHYKPGAMLNALQYIISFKPQKHPLSKCCHYFHFPNEEAKSRKGTCHVKLPESCRDRYIASSFTSGPELRHILPFTLSCTFHYTKYTKVLSRQSSIYSSVIHIYKLTVLRLWIISFKFLFSIENWWTLLLDRMLSYKYKLKQVTQV